MSAPPELRPVIWIGSSKDDAAELLGIDQPKVSRLLRGYLTNFSAERLMHFLTLLGRDVEIIVKPAPRSRRLGQVRVVKAA
jgi:transcriptional regulator with XRE-family HTH domain